MPPSVPEQSIMGFPARRRSLRRDTFIGYGWALGLVVIATISAYLISNSRLHLLTLAPLTAAVAITACFGGLGSTIMCGLLGSAAWLAVIAVDLHQFGQGHGIVWRWPDAPVRFIQFFAIATFISGSYFARRRAETNLRRAQQRLAVVLDESQIGTWYYDVSAGIFWLSPRMEAILGLQEGTAPGYAAFLDSIPAEDRPGVIDAMSLAIDRQMNYEVEHHVVRSDGSIRRIVMRGRPFTGRMGKAERIVGVGMDVTEGESSMMSTAVAS